MLERRTGNYQGSSDIKGKISSADARKKEEFRDARKQSAKVGVHRGTESLVAMP